MSTIVLRLADELRRAPADRCRPARDTGKAARCRAEIVLGRAATVRARALLDGRTVTILRVGRSYNRTVARVALAGRDVGSELVATGAARWWPRLQGKPDWCGRARR